jgi:hypothetical protein
MEERYPALFPHYCDWAERLDHECRRYKRWLGGVVVPKPTPEERTLLELEGLLIAVWLALQSDVASVAYDAYDEYPIIFEKETVVARFTGFLSAIWTVYVRQSQRRIR